MSGSAGLRKAVNFGDADRLASGEEQVTADQATAIAAAIDVILKVGPTGLLVIALWAFYTDRVVSGSRLKRSEDRETEAVNGWREQAEVTKEGNALIRQALDLLQKRRVSR